MTIKIKTMRGHAWLVAPLALAMIGACGIAQAVLLQADGWNTVAMGAATATQTAGIADITLPGGMTSGDVTLTPTSTDPSRQFTGDYAGARVTSIVVQLTGVNVAQLPEGTCLEIVSGLDTWTSDKLSITTANQPATNVVSAIRTAGNWVLSWQNQGLDNDTLEAKWAAALHNVASIRMIVPSDSRFAGRYLVSNFALDGDRAVQSLSLLEAALLARFGQTNVNAISPADAAYKSLGQRMTDLEIILANYIPGYFEEKLFRVEADEMDAAGLTIYWTTLANHTYTLLRATTASGPYEVVPAVDRVLATQTGTMSYTDLDAAVGVQYFYKVKQDFQGL
jgi:hypothetical protein